jgi:aryl-phospho-beta-D-glucosidase BglC (GH1 family)
MMRRFLLLCLLSALLIPNALPAHGQSGVPASRLERLARGVNLTGWYWYAPEDLQAVRTVFTPEDFTFIRDLGLTFVRVPLDLNFLLDEDDPDLLNDERLAIVDEGIRNVLAADLAFMFDLHSTSLADSDAANYSGKLEDPAFFQRYLIFWRSLAAHLSQYDPERLFIEPMNEPVFYDTPQVWEGLQRQLLAVIREAAPRHTLIATGARWSDLYQVAALTPLDDPNIIYNFHFYEPFLFTHQGATWTSEEVRPLRNVPYPSDPQSVQAASVIEDNVAARQALSAYGEERWDAARIQTEIQAVIDWGQKHGVALLCNEFGAYAPYSDPIDRARWTQDVRLTLEAGGIGWAMWEYDGDFGLTTRLENGDNVLDPAIAAALGLTLERGRSN